MARKQPTFADQLRDAIEQAGKTRYQISKETGIGQDMLSRFMAGKVGLSVDSINRLFENLGLTISKK